MHVGCNYTGVKGRGLFEHEADCEYSVASEEIKCCLCGEREPDDIHYCSVKGRGLPDLNSLLCDEHIKSIAKISFD